MAKPALPVAEILRITESHGARTVRVFGSRARGDACDDSNLDLLVGLEPGRSLLDIVAIKQDLEDLLGYSVDVVPRAGSPAICESAFSRKHSH